MLPHTSWLFLKFAALGAAVVACEAAPIELRFNSEETRDRQDQDGFTETDGTDETSSSEPSTAPPLPFSPGPACDSFPNDCALEDRPKCTLVSNNPGYRSSCVALKGELAEGESCERRVRGDDNCLPGGFCTPLGRGFELENRSICRRLCAATEQCEFGERCLQLLAAGPHGVCVQTCTVFADVCGDDGLRCAAAMDVEGDYFGYCEIIGSLGDGEPCTLTSQCQDGMLCELEGQVCRPSCDADHPCPDALRCVPFRVGVPGSLRLCVP